MPRRVMGIETEYGLTCASLNGGTPPLDPEESAQRLFMPVISQSRSTNTFLGNGSRLYLDVGSHPEYASAECDSIDDLLANDRAGELLFAKLAEQANGELAEENVAGAIHLFKNNLDAEGNSFGCHENYLVRRRPDYRARISSMVPYFVTRQIVTGAGHLAKGEDGTVTYEFSQRARQMWDAISSASTRSRPMINTRDEPHGDAEKYRRMHVIVGDSNIAQPTTALKVAATEAILVMIEDGGILPRFTLADPMEAIRATSADLTGRVPLALEGGGTATPLEIQRRTREAVLAHFDKKGYTPELDGTRSYLLDLWGRAIEAVDSGDYSGIVTEIDWAAKLNIMSRYCERGGLTLADPRIARLNLAYHDITANGLRASMEKSGMLRTILPDGAAENAMVTPPQTTRAKIRGEFVAAAQEQRRDYMADWMNLRLMEAQGARTVVLKDPFATVDSAAEALMAEI
ncbi:MAG: Pup--protein ligase [Ancrocorticia sp.]|uniref:Pup--protein ligase n=1 Tax=Ancrocorticia sp. TaxID=2593684 RepID=UPI003F939B90